MTLEDMSHLNDTLAQCWKDQETLVAYWHESSDMPAYDHPLRIAVAEQHWRNFQLWHVEDRARRTDIGDKAIAKCKRRIDALNQERNDYMERIDICVFTMLEDSLPALQPGRRPRYNTESIGAAVDRMSILSLKIYHMDEQARRTESAKDLRRQCREKSDILREQRMDLARSIDDLVLEYLQGIKRPKVFRQFKMYNDPRLNPELQAADRETGKISSMENGA
jgi:hypothetical protein